MSRSPFPHRQYLQRLPAERRLQAELLEDFLISIQSDGVSPFQTWSDFMHFAFITVGVKGRDFNEFKEIVRTLWTGNKMKKIAYGRSIRSLEYANVNPPHDEQQQIREIVRSDLPRARARAQAPVNEEKAAIVFVCKRNWKPGYLDRKEINLVLLVKEKGPQDHMVDANFDDLDDEIRILKSLIDFFFTAFRYPFDDIRGFIQDWLKMNISPSQCSQIIQELKKRYKKTRKTKGSLGPRSSRIFNMSEVIWGDSSSEGESGDESDYDKDEDTKEVPKTPGYLDRYLHLYGFAPEDFRDLVPITVTDTIMEDPESWLDSVKNFPKPPPITMYSDDADDAGPSMKKRKIT